MGEIITTWSPYHGQCKTTATTVAIANMYPNSIITHIQPIMGSMESMYDITNSGNDNVLNDNGFNSLIYTAMGKQITKEDVDTTVIQITDNLSFLPSSGRNKDDSVRNTIAEYILSEVLPKYYQYVFVDLGTETSEFAKNIQKKSSSNLIILSQNKNLWKRYNQTKNDKYILSGYSKESKYSKGLFQWTVSKNVDVVPYCIDYADAIAGHDVRNFFLRNENILAAHKNSSDLYIFFKELRRVKI